MDTVLIRNMSIPPNCDDCKLRTFDLMRGGMYCPLIDEPVVNQRYAKERHPECPLFEGMPVFYKPNNYNGEG